ncbi:MAG: transferrin-binding protein-like solute binding protein [Deltaproteobacteria bacterium]|nr:transferrin-binding protein-like solute binding protein [Deltaproteobacteria bacterium]
MKMLLRFCFMGLLSAVIVAGCGGGGGGDTPVTSGTISGFVTNAANYSGVQGVQVSAGNKSTITDSSGAYTLSGASPASSLIVTFAKTGFVPQNRTTTAYTTSSSQVSINVPMLAVAHTATFDPTVAQTISDPNSTAQVTLPAGGLRTASNSLPVGQVTAQVTPIDPANNLGTMPGNYLATTQSGSSVSIESFGAINVAFTDANGSPLNLASGQTSTIRIPVSSLPGQTLPNFIPLFFFNTSTGLWVQEGTATLKGTAPNQYYEGSVTHFSFWNADQILETVTYTSCVEDINGNPVAGALVTSTGTDYTGTASTTTNANGNFTVAVKSNAAASIQAVNGNVVSVALAIITGTSNITESAACLELTIPATGTLTIVKDAQPDGPQDFHFTTLGAGLSAFDLDDDPTNATLPNTKTFTPAVGVPFTVTEDAVSGWTVNSIQCTDAAAIPGSAMSPGSPGASIFTDPLNGTFTVILKAGSDVTCTFVNVMTTAGTGTLTIVKDAQPDGPQDFHFTTVGTGLSAFDLDDDPTNTTLSNTKTFINLAAGVDFTVTEDAVSGWTVPSIQCLVAVPGSTTTFTDQLNRTFTVNLEAGANVTCTFINENLTNPTPFTATGGPTLQVSTIAMIPTALQTSTDFTSTISGNSGTANVTAGPFGVAPDSIFTLSSTPTETTLVGAIATLPSSILLASGAPALSMTATSLWNTIPLASADFGVWAITNDIPNQPPSPVPVMTYSAYAGGTLTTTMPNPIAITYTGKMTGVLSHSPIGGSDDVSGDVSLTVSYTGGTGTITGLITNITPLPGASTITPCVWPVAASSCTYALYAPSEGLPLTFGDITVNGTINGNSFTDPTVTTLSIPAAGTTTITSPGAGTRVMNGYFYGANADEIAGTFTISHVQSGTPGPGMTLIGSFGAKQ